MAFATTEEVIEELRLGQMVIIVDDEERENEGDLLMAASCVQAGHVNFMATHGRGLICLTLDQKRCEQLKLPLMVRDNYSEHGTNFTLSIEAAEGVTTGISAADRATTIAAAVKSDAQPSDIHQPGHIFPLMAQPGGVLTRAGHTEAGCDLAKLAGFEPAAVIVEILNEDGSMARRPDLEILAKKHGLKLGTIADLIEFRAQNEKTVERVAECPLDTEFGQFQLTTYKDSIDGSFHMALVKGDVIADNPTLVRVHIENPLCDLTASSGLDCGWPLRDALQRVANEESGVVVILRNQVSSEDMINQIENSQRSVEDKVTRSKTGDLRVIGLGSQILADVGVKKMCVLSAPKRIHSISGFGLEIVEYVS